ncbi:hypothetical protein ABZP36_017311 [Zizania latifolia]
MATGVPKGRSSAKAAAAAAKTVEPRDVDLEPKVQWLDGAACYLVRVDLAGFKKEEFRVQVDGIGRVTVRGQRPAGHVHVHKEFQLPPTADLQRIGARFDGTTLCISVPKLPAGAAGTVLARMEEAKAVTTLLEMERAKWDRGEVIAAAVATFALGVIVTHRFFSARIE